MFFGKKEDKKKLPDLPSSRSSFGGVVVSPPKFGGFDDENSLPAFPDSPSHNKFSQAVIKDAVADKGLEAPKSEDEEEIVEMEEWNPSSFKAEPMKEKVEDLPEEEIGEDEEDSLEEEDVEEETEKPFVRREPIERVRKDYRPRGEDVFVKIDKFQSARKSLYEVKNGFNEMNELIRKIREVKMREEQEIAAWEKEMAQIKSRIKSVTENIFEKIE